MLMVSRRIYAVGLRSSGLPSRATILFYSMSDTEHAGAWVKGNLHDSDACTRILNDFAISWKYTMLHLVQKCRRVTLLEMFGEDVSQISMNSKSDKISSNCCDVCDQPCSESKSCKIMNCTSELQVANMTVCCSKHIIVWYYHCHHWTNKDNQ